MAARLGEPVCQPVEAAADHRPVPVRWQGVRRSTTERHVVPRCSNVAQLAIDLSEVEV